MVKGNEVYFKSNLKPESKNVDRLALVYIHNPSFENQEGPILTLSIFVQNSGLLQNEEFRFF